MGVTVSGTQRNFEQGSPQSTSRDMDVMIKGDGFFVVQLPNGESGFRRDGSFFKSANGRIETNDGYPIQPEIVVPANARKIEIAEDGAVHAVFNESREDADRPDSARHFRQ